MKSKKVLQGDATRAELLAAAREEFGARGYLDTSMDDIVLRADVTKGAFYHHFSGKKELFLRVFEEVKKELSRAAFVTHVDHEPFSGGGGRAGPLNRFVEQDDDEVWSQLLERCERYIELHTDPKIRRIALLDSRSVLTPEEWQRVEREHGVVLLRADLRRAMRRGILRRLPLRALSVILTGALNEACMLVVGAEEDADEALADAMTVVRRLLEGLRVGAAESAD
ncbi:MAG: helix-turn-helix domain-containing protein [Gemmatimonadota bacterium]